MHAFTPKPFPDLAMPHKHLLHLVFGGELTSLDLDKVEFRDLNAIDFVGLFPDYKSAYAAWKAKAQSTVDNARIRYFIVHLHRLMDPEHDDRPEGQEAVRKSET